MRILKQLTRKKKMLFFRDIKFNLINHRYRNKPERAPFDPSLIRHVFIITP